MTLLERIVLFLAVCRAFLVGDLPFGSYETSAQQAVQSAVRMMKEGLMDAVKLEGAQPPHPAQFVIWPWCIIGQ